MKNVTEMQQREEGKRSERTKARGIEKRKRET
jgi:hypothetical protein